MSEKNTYLFDDFQAVSTSEWMEKITKDLKGADFEKKLLKKTLDGITVKPFYREEDIKDLPYRDILPGQFPYIRGNDAETKAAEVHADICFNKTETAAQDAAEFTQKGVNSLGFRVYTENTPTADELKTLLKAIDTETVSLHFAGMKDPVTFAENLAQALPNPKTARGSIDMDPLGNMLRIGSCCEKEQCSCFEELTEVLNFCKSELPQFKVINLQAKHLRNAGATAVQELGFIAAAANEYMAALSEAGFDPAFIAEKMMFSFGIGSDYFIEIAKLRAARLVWSKIVSAWCPDNLEAAKTFFHSETAVWNKTAYDAYVNMLRTTTESMSALLGGSDSLSVMPFDITYKAPDAFSKRIARNIQIILNEESKFDQIKDPAAGAYYIEYLTHETAEKAWDLFKAVEAKGGFNKAMAEGFIQAEVTRITDERDRRIALGREAILGTNQFPNSAEQMADKIDEQMYHHFKNPDSGFVQPLKMYRGAEAFEEMRLKTEKADKRPKVFLLTIGNRVMRTARATFASNFFGCAGFEIENNIGFDTVEEGVKAAEKSDADIIVLCSSDDEYKAFVPELTKEISGKAIPVVAGYPKEDIENFKKLGVNYFIHIKSDILNTLKAFQKELGIV